MCYCVTRYEKWLIFDIWQRQTIIQTTTSKRKNITKSDIYYHNCFISGSTPLSGCSCWHGGQLWQVTPWPRGPAPCLLTSAHSQPRIIPCQGSWYHRSRGGHHHPHSSSVVIRCSSESHLISSISHSDGVSSYSLVLSPPALTLRGTGHIQLW